METIREIVFYKNYFHAFFEPLTEKVKEKIDEVLFMMTISKEFQLNFSKPLLVLKDCMKFGLNTKVIFTEYFAVLTKEI